MLCGVLWEGLSTDAGLMTTLTAERVGSSISQQVTPSAWVLPALGFRRPLFVLLGLESQIPLESDLRPSPVAFRLLEGLVSVLRIFCVGDSRQATKPETKTPSSRERELLPADCVLGWGGLGGGSNRRREGHKPHE